MIVNSRKTFRMIVSASGVSNDPISAHTHNYFTGGGSHLERYMKTIPQLEAEIRVLKMARLLLFLLNVGFASTIIIFELFLF